MKKEIVKKDQSVSAATLEKVLLGGDISSLQPDQKVAYYQSVCESVGLNPLTKPFDFIRLNGREVMYVKREATEQLRKLHHVSISITNRELIGDAYVVTAKAKSGDREDESTGVVAIKGLIGEALANAYMKSETKAKRRVTLSICGLGLMDETEIDGADPGGQKATRIQESLKEYDKPVIIPEIELPPQKPGKIVVPVIVNEDAEPPNFDDVEPFESFDELKPKDKAVDFFTIDVGTKLKGKKLMEFSTPQQKSDLEYWAKSTKKWFQDEKKTINQKWQETFENIGLYLGVNI